MSATFKDTRARPLPPTPAAAATTPAPPPSRRRPDLPTLAVAAATYGGWGLTTALHARLPSWALALVGGWLIAWHGSLQHETIHGRPTGVRGLDALVGGLPLSLWLPYGRYRDSHLAHHATPHVTDPAHDPESRYLRAAGGAAHLAARAQATLLGRLLLGPAASVAGFLWAEAGRLRRGEPGVRRAWAWHLAGALPVLLWLHACGLGLGRYLLAFVLPGTALTLLRAFAEHRADPDPRRRAAVVERAPVLALLFLHNNLHAAHHARPDLAWWELPRFYARHRPEILKANGGLVYRGYREVAARFLLRPHDAVLHPAHRPAAPAERAA
jgi:fatty acid desaturase